MNSIYRPTLDGLFTNTLYLIYSDLFYTSLIGIYFAACTHGHDKKKTKASTCSCIESTLPGNAVVDAAATRLADFHRNSGIQDSLSHHDEDVPIVILIGKYLYNNVLAITNLCK